MAVSSLSPVDRSIPTHGVQMVTYLNGCLIVQNNYGKIPGRILYRLNYLLLVSHTRGCP